MNPITILVISILVFAGAILLTALSGKLILTLSSLAFFLPFERIPTIELGSFTLKINHILGAFLLFIWVVDRIHSRKKLQKNVALIPIVLLIGSIILSILQAEVQSRSIIFTILIIFTMLISIATTDIIRNFQDYQKIEKAIIISSWVVLFFSVWQFFGDLVGVPLSLTGLIEGYSKITFGFPRIQAFSKEPLYLGNFLMIPIGILTGKMLSPEKKIKSDKILLAGLVGLLILTLSRGAILGFIFFILMLAIYFPKKVLSRKNILIGLSGLAIIFASVLLIVNIAGDKTLDRFIHQLTLKDFGVSESTVLRLGDSQVAYKAWQQNPLLGVGIGNFGVYKANYELASPDVESITNNQYLELLAETGIIGFGLFVLIIIMLLSRSYRAIKTTKNEVVKPLLAGLSAAFFGILVQYNFFSTLSIIHIWFLIGLIIALQNIALDSINRYEKQ